MASSIPSTTHPQPQHELQSLIRCILNVQDPPQKRIEALRALNSFVKNQSSIIRNSFDRLLPTLEQLLIDRIPTIRSEVALVLGTVGASVQNNYDSCNKFVRWMTQNLTATIAQKEMSILFLSTLNQVSFRG